ncbi:MAG TPA: aconitate hydratase AcnA [Brevundimonas sp.]|nr:aconitate hydratase AcnA [Brevundimonas sp.]
MNEAYRRRLLGTSVEYFDVRAAVHAIQPGAYDRLPYVSRVLAEQLVRHCDPASRDEALRQIVERKRDLDFPWYPARVVCHDILGQTALVDLAGLRDAIAEQGGDPAKVNPVVPTQLIVDHSLAVEAPGFDPEAFAKNRAIEDRRNEDRFHFIEWTKRAFENVDVIPAGNGIMHQINLEKMSPVVQVRDGVAFPDTCVGTDSHTPHVDALGVIAIGVGGLEAETVMLGRPSMMRLPDIVGVKLTGRRHEGITATDIVLALTEFLRKERVVGAWLEFFGEGADSLTIGDRATISNMCPEYGATAAMFYIDQQTIDYLRLTGREPDQIELVETYAKTIGLWADALKTADYERVLAFDLSTVERNLAGPSNPHRRLPTSALQARGVAVDLDGALAEERDGLMPDGAVIIAAITSCTNTSNPRNVVAAGLVARKANALGLVRKPWVKTSLVPGSQVTADVLERAQLQDDLDVLGFNIAGFGCTTCNGGSGPLPANIVNAIESEKLIATAVLSGNRNFEGRIHANVRAAYLASPALVVAYALAGNLNVDLTRDPLGKDQDGKDVYLSDIWPKSAEVQEAIHGAYDRDLFIERYAELYDGGEPWDALARESNGGHYTWEADSTYIRKPPYFDGLQREPAPVANLRGMRPLAILGDSITTDHISPSGSISLGTPAADFLLSKGVEQKDFNNYTTRRANHEVVKRATFANIRLRNKIVPGVEGGVTKVMPEGEVMRIFEAAQTYQERQVPLLVIAGKNYGCGSSRDSAAKGPALLGVKAVVAEGFERIHRTNLVGMGVLPLQFQDGTNADTLGLDGTETFDVKGLEENLGVRSQAELIIHRLDGSTQSVPVIVRLDTVEDMEYWRHGGILPRVWRKYLEN